MEDKKVTESENKFIRLKRFYDEAFAMQFAFLSHRQLEKYCIYIKTFSKAAVLL